MTDTAIQVIKGWRAEIVEELDAARAELVKARVDVVEAEAALAPVRDRISSIRLAIAAAAGSETLAVAVAARVNPLGEEITRAAGRAAAAKRRIAGILWEISDREAALRQLDKCLPEILPEARPDAEARVDNVRRIAAR